MIADAELIRIVKAVAAAFSQTHAPVPSPKSNPYQLFQAEILCHQASATAYLLRRSVIGQGSGLAAPLEAFGLGQSPRSLRDSAIEEWACAACETLSEQRDRLVRQLRADLSGAVTGKARWSLLHLIALGDLDFVRDRLDGEADTRSFAIQHVQLQWLQNAGQVYEAVIAAEALRRDYPVEAMAARLDQSYRQRLPGLPAVSAGRARLTDIDALRSQIIALQQGNQIEQSLRLALRHLPLLRSSVPVCQILLPSLMRWISGNREAAEILEAAGRDLPPHLKLAYLRSTGKLDARALGQLLAAAFQQEIPINHLDGLVQEAWEVAAMAAPLSQVAITAQAALLAIRPQTFLATSQPLRSGLLNHHGLHVRDTAAQADLLCGKAQMRARQAERPPALALLATERARACIASMGAVKGGILLYGNHTAELDEISYLAIQLVSAGVEKPTLSMLRAGSDRVFQMHRGWAAGSSPHGANISLMNIYGMDEGEQIRGTLDHLRAGGVLDVANDGLFAPGVRVLVPWIVRPYVVRVFPAQAALATRSKVFFRTIHITDDRQPQLDMVPVEPPPDQGSLRVRSIWLTQRLARLTRQFAREKPHLFSDRQMARFGGVPSPRALLDLAQWGTADTTRKSLVGWLGGTTGGAETGAGSDSELSATSLRGRSLRAAGLLLHFQANKLDHHQQDRPFLGQHRVAVIAPQGPAFMALSIAALASGSLICPMQDDLSSGELAERLAIFSPDLIVSGASVWTRVLAADSGLQHAPVMIMDDAGDGAALDELLTGFAPASHLPSFQPHQPGFVVFTSGSDGRPKGVVVAAGVLSSETGLDRCAELGPDDRIAYLTRWDAVGLADLIACLRGGSTLVPVPSAVQTNPVELAAWLHHRQISVWSAPTTLWKLLLRTPAWQDGSGLTVKKGLLWGEPITGSVLAQLRDRHPQLEAFCIYGSTEVTYTAFGRAEDAFDASIAGSPGGWLVDQTSLEAIETEDDPDPVYLAESPNAMIGYYADLAASNAEIARSARRVFCLSDRLQIGENGCIHVLGRRDSIIKIAGRRYALAALEHACCLIDGVRTALVFAELVDETVEVRIVVEAQDGEEATLVAAVRDAVGHATGNVIRPKSVHVMATLPSLPSGKISRQALKQQIYGDAPGSADPTPVAEDPGRNPVERALFAWAIAGGLLAPFDPPDRTSVPELSSLDWMELQLLAEEFGSAATIALMGPDAAELSWTELARKIAQNGRQPTEIE
tara:strand:+ start:48692 stop:52405 length:3714 start_codon:yes stop_codon:yes gene_type:complete